MSIRISLRELYGSSGRESSQSALAEGLIRLMAYVFAHGCLSAAWSLEDNQNPDYEGGPIGGKNLSSKFKSI